MDKRKFIKTAGALTLGALTTSNLIASDADEEKSLNQDTKPSSKALTNLDADSKFDYIIIGGGTAGPIIATRLSENTNVTVLLIEAGAENTKEGMLYANGVGQMWTPDTNWGFNTTAQDGLKGRKIMAPRGKVLGGSASINVGSWSRGTAENYNSWNLEGWDWDTIKAWYKKIEHSDKGDKEYRGFDGPMKLEVTPEGTFMTDEFKKASKEVGIGNTDDMNGKKLEGADNWQCIFKNGIRHNTVSNYLDHARLRPNLTVQTNTFVSKVIVKDNAATGVTCFSEGKTQTITAQKEVIICTGTFATPKLLMLSGIGPASYLKSMGIAVVKDIPGVGENLSDQLRIDFGVTAPGGIGKSLRANPEDPAQMEEWRNTGYGPLSVAENTSVAFCKSSKDVPVPDIELMFNINAPMQYGSPPPKNAGYYFNVGLVQPKSKGHIRLASTDPKDTILINPNYLGDERDIKAFIKGYRLAMKYPKTNALGKYSDLSTLTISLDATDKEIEEHIRSKAESIYHPVGTAKMGRDDDDMAVVDTKLKVKGIKNLRIADASVIPELISGHTMAPTVMIAERAADFIKKEMK